MKQPKNDYANIVEIFSSIQGEGPFIGYKQLFIRFADCNLSCDYCDTDFLIQDKCNVYFQSKKIEYFANPLFVDELIDITVEFHKKGFHSISFTGGEPLIQSEYINTYITRLKKYIDTKYYLETNGTLPNELDNVIKNIDIVSMDIKIESSTGQRPSYSENIEFVQLAKAYKKAVFAKVIVSSNVTKEELVRVAELCAKQSIPLIIQPMSTDKRELQLKTNQINSIIDFVLQKYNNVRLIPQVHKFLNLQ